MSANAAFPAVYPQLISPNVNVYQSPAHDPVGICTIPTVLPFKKKKEQQQEAGSTISVSDIHQDRSLSFLLAENHATGISKDGKKKQLAGTVQIFHIPSLPDRLPSRFPLDAPANDSLNNARVKEEGAADLPGLSRYHAELIERDPPPPFKSWTLEVPLSESDLISEASSSSTEAAEPRGRVGGVTQAYGARQMEVPSGKDKEDNERRPGYSLKSINEVPVSVQNARMGMDGKVIVVLGTRGRVWVYRIKDGHRIRKTGKTR
jgi:polycomb protein EED